MPVRGLVGVARQLIRAGRVGLLIGWRADQAGLLLAVTIAPARVTFLPPGDDGLPLIRRIRLGLDGEGGSLLRTATTLADALDLDASGRRTFALLYQLVADGAASLSDQAPIEDRHSWILIQCTRLLFLRFVESEGWLNQDPAFLSRHFDHLLHRKLDPTTSWLNTLFFGTLNLPLAERRDQARSLGRIPFLNGGLFERHPVELQYQFQAPLSWWNQAVDALTGKISVSLEPAIQRGEVSPEMLGRVFEGVMLPGERKRNGTFYTPAPLVRAMVRAALLPLLAGRMKRSEGALEAALSDPDPALRSEMLALRILDPAVGSGAFLVGALELLHGPGPRQAERVRHLVTHSLHGIDLHPGAVRITELRLWLETLRPLRGQVPESIPPLPNLDTTIRAGNTLFDPLHQPVSPALTRQLSGFRNAVANTHGPAKRAALTAWRQSERAALIHNLRAGLSELRQKRDELHGLGQEVTLFGTPRGYSPDEIHRLRRLNANEKGLQDELAALIRGDRSGSFAAAIAFAPILSEGGFDLVLGNPPWVRAERLTADHRGRLSERYQWWRNTGRKGFQHQPDLSVAFLERSLELTRPGGVLAMLVSAKLATTAYATAARSSLSHSTTLQCVADLTHAPMASFQATTYPMALIATRTPPPPGHNIRLALDRDDLHIAQTDWQIAPQWTLSTQRESAWLRALQKHPVLGDSYPPQLGIKTGANRIFLNPPVELHAWTRMALRGRDISGWPKTPKHSTRLLWTADATGKPLHRLPEQVARYLEQHRNQLEQRADLSQPPWWRLFRTGPASSPHRVVWGDLTLRLKAISLEDNQILPLNSCYLIILPSASQARNLSAWLNSTWIRLLARRRADHAAGGYARFNARVIASLPLPITVSTDPSLAALADPCTRADQEELDRITAHHLELSHSDRELLKSLAEAGS